MQPKRSTSHIHLTSLLRLFCQVGPADKMLGMCGTRDAPSCEEKLQIWFQLDALLGEADGASRWYFPFYLICLLLTDLLSYQRENAPQQIGVLSWKNLKREREGEKKSKACKLNLLRNVFVSRRLKLKLKLTVNGKE